MANPHTSDGAWLRGGWGWERVAPSFLVTPRTPRSRGSETPCTPPQKRTFGRSTSLPSPLLSRELRRGQRAGGTGGSGWVSLCSVSLLYSTSTYSSKECDGSLDYSSHGGDSTAATCSRSGSAIIVITVVNILIALLRKRNATITRYT